MKPTRSSHAIPVALVATIGLVVALAAPFASPAFAQPAADGALRQQIERRFDVLPLHDGVALKPKAPGAGVRSIEVSGDTIALDGQPVTGGELRQKLGADADLVLRLSYLEPAARRSLFGGAPAPPSAPGVGAPAASPIPPPAVSEPAAPEFPAPPRRSERRNSRGDAKVRFGGSITVKPDDVVGDTVVIGGSIRVDGRVVGDVVAVGGSVDLGPTADITGDVAVVGGTLHRDPGAHIGGKVNEVATGSIDVGRLRLPRGPFQWWNGSTFGAGFALVSTLTRIAVLCLLACLAVLLARDYVTGVGARAVAEPVKAGIVGLLAELLLVPLLIVSVIVLVITIIGIPLLVLLPFAVLAIAALFLLGYTAIAHRVGVAVADRFGWSRDNPYTSTLIGIATIAAPVAIARLLGVASGLLFPLTATIHGIGLFIEYLVWTVGFGAVALQRFSRRSGPTHDTLTAPTPGPAA